jgi:large subunit ribosomal protein L9
MGLQLLLIEDVDGLGQSGDVVKAPRPGYVRNYLLPQGLAVIADKRTLRMQEKLKEERKKRAAIDLKESTDIAEKIGGTTLTITVKVDNEGHMYGSVSTLDIVHLLEKEHHAHLERKMVLLKHAIKETGIHEVDLRLKEGVTCSITLKVVAEAHPEHAEGHSK